MNNVIKFERKESLWDRKYGQMSMPELMEEMVKYNEEKLKANELTSSLIVQGIVLFSYIEKSCRTSELRLLASTYRRHLEHEKANQITKTSSRD